MTSLHRAIRALEKRRSQVVPACDRVELKMITRRVPECATPSRSVRRGATMGETSRAPAENCSLRPPMNRVSRSIIVLAVALLFLSFAPAQPPDSPESSAGAREWPAYGGGPAQMRYSSLRQINRANV